MITQEFTIPTSTILAMIVTILFLVAVVVIISIQFMRRYPMNLSAIILGLLMYIGFDTILLSLFDSLVVGELSGAVRIFIFEPMEIHCLFCLC